MGYYKYDSQNLWILKGILIDTFPAAKAALMLLKCCKSCISDISTGKPRPIAPLAWHRNVFMSFMESATPISEPHRCQSNWGVDQSFYTLTTRQNSSAAVNPHRSVSVALTLTSVAHTFQTWWTTSLVLRSTDPRNQPRLHHKLHHNNI